jgi:hypothetical protein
VAPSAPIEGIRGRAIYYRLYRLSGPSGRFVGFEEIEAPDDAAALQLSQSFAGEHPFELWCGARKVGVIPAAAPQPKSPRKER